MACFSRSYSEKVSSCFVNGLIRVSSLTDCLVEARILEFEKLLSFEVFLCEFTFFSRVLESPGFFHVVFIHHLFHTLCVDEGTLDCAS